MLIPAFWAGVPDASSAQPVCSIAAVHPSNPSALPVVIRLTCTSAVSVTVDFGSNELGNLRFAVRNSGGATEFRSLPLSSFTYLGRVNVTPEQPFQKRINLAELEPNSLSDRVEVTVALVRQKDNQELLRTNTVQISVDAPNEAKTSEACKRLGLQIEGPISFELRAELASELASVRNSAAIPVMAALLKKNLGIDTRLIDGLQLIGTEEAKEVLRDYAAHAPGLEEEQYARSALTRMVTF